jgi:hypothetical protein
MYAKAVPPEQEPAEEYASLLEEVVTDDGYVDYAKLEADRRPLDRYVAWLSGENPLRGKQTGDHHAFWLNAYNALALFEVLERGRPATVLDVKGWLPMLGAGFFRETQFKVEDDWLTLGEIQDERLRWMELDLRDQAAMTRASRSGPPMRKELYTRGDLERQLRDQMRRWLDDDDRGVRVEDDRAVFNPIFQWYARDFDFFSAGKDICEIASNYTSAKKSRELSDLSERGCPHAFFDYDWRLNDATTSAASTTPP